MNQQTTDADLPDQKTVLGWNYMAHCIEGGLFFGGLAFVSAEVILPRLAELLDAPSWVISAMPLLVVAGFCLPTLFTAHVIERLNTVMPLLKITGIIQRLPFLIAGVILWYIADSSKTLALYVVVLAPLLSGFIGGLFLTAWQELVAKTIPANRRASVLAVRNIIGALIGMLAGGIIVAILDRFPGVPGYGLLYMICFGFLLLSFLVFVLIRETHQEPRDVAGSHSMTANFRRIPSIIKADRSFRNFLLGSSVGMGMFIMIPYFAIHVLRTTARPDSFLGFLVTAQMVGGIAGNVFAGILGDRRGLKLPMIIGFLVFAGVAAAAVFTESPAMFIVHFFLTGFALFTFRVCTMALGIEISPFDKRSTYLALASSARVPAMAATTVISAIVWDRTENFAVLAILTIITMLISIFLIMRVDDPRNA